MSFIFSRALVEEYSQENCSDTDASAPLNGNPTLRPCLWHDKTTEHSRLSRFGMTCEPLTADLGAELLTWYREGFPAKTSAQPAKAMGWTANDPGFGRRWPGLLAKFDRDSLSWKTAQNSLVEGWDEFSQTWPAWGSMRNGECWERITPELPTCATEFGLWPTPCATDSSDRKVSARMHETKRGTFKHVGANGTLSQIRLSQVVKHRTPNGTGRLSPDWTEWFLMGWPIGHTGLKPLAMDKYQSWLQQHGACLAESDEILKGRV